MKFVSILLVLSALASGFEFKMEKEIFQVLNEPFEAQYDSVYHPCGDDCGGIEIRSRNRYLCRDIDSTVTLAKLGHLIYEGKNYPVEMENMYNLDSVHSNIHYLKRRKVAQREYLFGKFGPKGCTYYVLWELERNKFSQKDLFESVIEYDNYEHEKELMKYLKGQVQSSSSSQRKKRK